MRRSHTVMIDAAVILAAGAFVMVVKSDLTSSPLFTGPLAIGVFAQISLGNLLGFAISAILYAVLGRGVLRQRELGQPVGATGHEEAVNVA